MNIKELQQFYAFKHLGPGVSQVSADPSDIAMVVQLFPFVVREETRLLKLGQISAGISYEDIIQEKTKQYPNVDRGISLAKAIKAVAVFDK